MNKLLITALGLLASSSALAHDICIEVPNGVSGFTALAVATFETEEQCQNKLALLPDSIDAVCSPNSEVTVMYKLENESFYANTQFSNAYAACHQGASIGLSYSTLSTEGAKLDKEGALDPCEILGGESCREEHGKNNSSKDQGKS